MGHELDGADRPALEAVAEYIARGPVSLERLEVEETGPSPTPRVIYRSPKVHPRHGADFRIFDPLEFLAAFTDEDVIYRILTHLDLLEPDPPPRPPPREEICEAALAEVASQELFDFGGFDA